LISAPEPAVGAGLDRQVAHPEACHCPISIGLGVRRQCKRRGAWASLDSRLDVTRVSTCQPPSTPTALLLHSRLRRLLTRHPIPLHPVAATPRISAVLVNESRSTLILARNTAGEQRGSNISARRNTPGAFCVSAAYHLCRNTRGTCLHCLLLQGVATACWTSLTSGHVRAYAGQVRESGRALLCSLPP
jgi:hypothetical protein